MRVMVIDSETGGIDSNSYSLLSLAAVVIDLDAPEFQVIDSWEAYHKLSSINAYKVSAKALEINGLTIQEVFDKGIPTEELCEKLVDTWNKHGCSAIAGQNYGFDKKFIARRLFRISDDAFEQIFSKDGRHNILDTLHIARMLTGVLPVKNMHLQSLIKAFNVDTKSIKGDYHTALFDTLITAKLLYQQKKIFEHGYKTFQK